MKAKYKHPLHGTWKQMKYRCNVKHRPSYHLYGGRGISVCKRWLDDFWAFAEDMGDKPTVKHELDRIDNDGNYEPSNCRWLTSVEQKQNMRIRKDNTSKVRGVSWNEDLQNWRVRLTLEGKKVYDASFGAYADAVSDRMRVEKIFWNVYKK